MAVIEEVTEEEEEDEYPLAAEGSSSSNTIPQLSFASPRSSFSSSSVSDLSRNSSSTWSSTPGRHIGAGEIEEIPSLRMLELVFQSMRIQSGRMVEEEGVQLLQQAAAYEEIISRLEYTSMEDLYSHLYDSILIDHGRMGLALDKTNNKICYILSPRALEITWGGDSRYWRWKHDPDSRFTEVAELKDVCWLEINGYIDIATLSPETTYAAYLIFKLTRFGPSPKIWARRTGPLSLTVRD